MQLAFLLLVSFFVVSVSAGCVTQYTDGQYQQGGSHGDRLCFKSKELLDGLFKTRFVRVHDSHTKILYSSSCDVQEKSNWDYFGYFHQSEAKFSPFEDLCFRSVSSNQTEHTMRISHEYDLYGLLQFAVALFLFIFAPSLTRSDFVLYSCTFSLGSVLAFIIILFFIMNRFAGRKTAFTIAGMAMMAQSAAAYFAQYFIENFLVYAIGFACFFGLVSVAMVYRYDIGEKDKVLMSVGLRIISIIIAYNSFPSASTFFPANIQQDPTGIVAAAFVVLSCIIGRRAGKRSSSSSSSSSEIDYSAAATGNSTGIYTVVGRRVRHVWNALAAKRLSKDKVDMFVVKGAAPYISSEEYERQSIDYTKLQEKALLDQYRSNPDKYATVLSPAARKRMQKLACADQDTDSTFEHINDDDE